ncbi:MAG: hypothetical protein WD847_00935 [Pirellulales bacterium]
MQEWPHLVRRVDDQDQLLGYVVQGQADAQLWFDMDNGELTARFGSKQTLVFDRESWTFVLTDPSGNVTNFAAFDQIESGMFLCDTDPGGVVTKVAAFHSNGQQIAEVERSGCSGWTPTTSSTGPNIGRNGQTAWEGHPTTPRGFASSGLEAQDGRHKGTPFSYSDGVAPA